METLALHGGESGLVPFMQNNATYFLFTFWLLIIVLAQRWSVRENDRHIAVLEKLVSALGSQLEHLNYHAKEIKEHLADMSGWPPGKKIGEDHPVPHLTAYPPPQPAPSKDDLK